MAWFAAPSTGGALTQTMSRRSFPDRSQAGTRRARRDPDGQLDGAGDLPDHVRYGVPAFFGVRNETLSSTRGHRRLGVGGGERVQQLAVGLHHRAHLRLELGPLPLELVDVFHHLDQLLVRAVDDLLRLVLGLGDDDLRLLLRGVLQVLLMRWAVTIVSWRVRSRSWWCSSSPCVRLSSSLSAMFSFTTSSNSPARSSRYASTSRAA